MKLLEFWITILLPVLSILIPVFATIYTVNMRLKNQNRENHQPYLVLKKITTLSKLDIYSYYLTIIGRNYQNLTEKKGIENLQKEKNDNDISISIVLQNIGYGVATNILFYDLLIGKQIHGTQESNKEQNQKLFTTFDAAIGNEKIMQARVITYVDDEIINGDDHNRILCVYKDLNNNIYNFIISINVKSNNTYDFFAYQPSSRSYKKWIKENKKEYNKILKNYKER